MRQFSAGQEAGYRPPPGRDPVEQHFLTAVRQLRASHSRHGRHASPGRSPAAGPPPGGSLAPGSSRNGALAPEAQTDGPTAPEATHSGFSAPPLSLDCSPPGGLPLDATRPGGLSLDGSALDAAICLQLFDAQLASRHLDLAARWLRARGAGYYTIGSAGHEGNAGVAAALRLTDPALLHYRSGAFYLARAGQARPPADGVQDTVACVPVTLDTEGEPGAVSVDWLPACGVSVIVSIEYGGSAWLVLVP